MHNLHNFRSAYLALLNHAERKLHIFRIWQHRFFAIIFYFATGPIVEMQWKDNIYSLCCGAYVKVKVTF